jgi:Ca-activated chloride channel family protein
MRRILPVLLVLAAAAPAQAHGLLIPTEKSVPPLAMLNHHVTIRIDDQVAVTKVEQTFRNHTDRELEATYIFPVPRGASVRKFSMWVGGTEVPGELVEADKARKIYTDIVRRTQDPGLLEYMGNNLLRLRVFPVPRKGDQKVMIAFTSVAQAEDGLVEYTYPLKTDGKATATLEKFSIKLDLKSQHPIQNIYSPTHAITVNRPTDRQAVIGFEKEQGLLDKDFTLYYTAGGKDVGLTALSHRPSAGKDGHFMMLISPRAELSKSQQVPRDMIFVLDTSGSMRGKRMDQARSALKYCLSQLTDRDRFAVINFATTVNKYTDQLLPGNAVEVERARKWADNLEATGGTAINDALAAALDMRTSDATRTFTVVFFTDGRPTIGETNPDKILKSVVSKNNANTRIFTFGVGDDVNATMLDQLAEQTRALNSYVRETEDIEVKVSSLYGKISNPVLTNLKLTVGSDVKISEVYPPQLPDLFHGNQLVVLGRYSGYGHVAVKLTGSVGKDTKEFVYETTFAEKTGDEKNFVEDLWARRKVGYLLDQIRINGQQKELVNEVVALAKRYGITTPYTSYLIVPDAPVPVAGAEAARQHGRPNVAFNLGGTGGNFQGGFGGGGYQAGTGNGFGGFGGQPALLQKPGQAGTSGGTSSQTTVLDALKKVQAKPGDVTKGRFGYAQQMFEQLGDMKGKDDAYSRAIYHTQTQWYANNAGNAALIAGRYKDVQDGKLGVDLSCQSIALRCQERLTNTASRYVQSRNCVEVGGVWVDEGYDPSKMKTVTVKAMSDAYFRILERHPGMKEVFRLSNHLVWVSPSGTALIVDTTAGEERMTDAAIDALFVARKK